MFVLEHKARVRHDNKIFFVIVAIRKAIQMTSVVIVIVTCHCLVIPNPAQSNLCGILATCWERGCEIFVGDKSHIALYEQGGFNAE